MKKITFLLLAVVFGLSVNAQTPEGHVFDPQTSNFTLEFDVTPVADMIDAALKVQPAAGTAEQDYVGPFLLFSTLHNDGTNGTIEWFGNPSDGSGGGRFDTGYKYEGGVKYNIRIDAFIPSYKYNVYIKKESETEFTTLVENAGWANGYNPVARLTNDHTEALTIENVVVGDDPDFVWNFETEGSTEGFWGANQIDGLSATGGSLVGTLNAPTATHDPNVNFPYPSDLNADVLNQIKIRIKNNTETTLMSMLFEKAGGLYGVVDFPIEAGSVNSDFQDITIDMTTYNTDWQAAWDGTIFRLRLDFSTAEAENGDFAIDYIRVTKASPHADATLSNLAVDGTTVSGFDSAIISYDIELAEGTTIVPALDYLTTDINAKVVVTNAASLPGNSTVRVIAEDGTTEKTYTINFTVSSPSLSVESELADNLKLYPNPASGQINVELSSLSENSSLDIFDISGKIVYTQSLIQLENAIDISGLDKGVYFITIQTGKNNYSEKIVVE